MEISSERDEGLSAFMIVDSIQARVALAEPAS